MTWIPPADQAKSGPDPSGIRGKTGFAAVEKYKSCVFNGLCIVNRFREYPFTEVMLSRAIFRRSERPFKARSPECQGNKLSENRPPYKQKGIECAS